MAAIRRSKSRGLRGIFVILAAAAVVCLVAEGAYCRTITVRADGSGDYPTIQAAIDAADDGAEVVLEPGTYTDEGNRDIDFLGKAITVRSTDPCDANVVEATVIDCNGAEVNRHRGFYFHSGEDGNSVVDGLTITGGYAPEEQFEGEFGPSLFSVGGGIFCYGSSPSIRRCRIVDNFAKGTSEDVEPYRVYAFGGGICWRGGAAKITGCTISGNLAESNRRCAVEGGGIFFWESSGEIKECIITVNEAKSIATAGRDAYGGGVCIDPNSSAVVENCVISGNKVLGSTGSKGMPYYGIPGGPGGRACGSGIYCGGLVTVENCMISDNIAVGGDGGECPGGCGGDGGAACGGGVYVESLSDSTIRGCTITDNTLDGGNGVYDGDEVGSGLYCASDTGRIENCIIEDNVGSPTPGDFSFEGGAVFFEECNGVIAKCTIRGNSGFEASGIGCRGGSPMIENCTIASNTGSRGGIGCYEQSKALIVGTKIEGNVASAWGGGIFCLKSSPTIIDCEIIGNTGVDGGGLYCMSQSDVRVDGTTISGNVSSSEGSAVYFKGSWGTENLVVERCTVSNNEGRGLFFQGNSLVVDDCTITGNSVTEGGGGICCYAYDLLITKSDVSGNTAESGGGISCNGNAVVTNCIVSGNSARWTGGIYCHDGNLDVRNCTITGNVDDEGYGGGVGISSGSQLVVTNCILWSNLPNQLYGSGQVRYSDVQGGWEGEGNIDLEPVFAFEGQYYIMVDSPCIDAADPNYVSGLNETDVDGNPRVLDGDGDGNAFVDMGAYEFDPNSPKIVISADSFYFVPDCAGGESQTLFVRNGGGVELFWEIVEDCNWLEVWPASGASMGEIDEVVITVDPNGLAPGIHRYAFTVEDPNAYNNPVEVGCVLSWGAIGQPWDGNGVECDPYQIWDANDMQAIGADANYWDAHFVLCADIDLSAYTGTSYNVIGKYTVWYDPNNRPFTGVFDGNGRTISNFTYNSDHWDYIGLFGYINDPNAEIKNLGLIGPNIDAGTRGSVGCIVGYMENGTVIDCYVEGGIVRGESSIGGLVGRNDGDITACYSAGSVTGEGGVGGLVGHNDGEITGCHWAGSVTGGEGEGGNVGGLVGHNDGDITGCYSMGSVTGEEEVGGLVGGSTGSISNCHSTCSVTGTGMWGHIGGLVGNNEEGSILNSYSTGHVTGEYEIGGLVGRNDGEGKISACYSTGSVTGRYNVGGLVGDNSNGYITSCYCTGSVTGESGIGGLVGYAKPYVTIENCYSTGSVAGIGDFVGGLVGRGCAKNSYWDVNSSGMSTSSDGIGLTTKQMQSKGTYLFWGCEQKTWTIDDGSDYPRLWWEGKPGEVIDFACGTAEEPYLIYEAVQMQVIGDGEWNLDKHYKLMADIDLGGYGGRSFNLIGYDYFYSESSPFRGVFDGGGHAISNFTYDSNQHVDYIGLFGWVDDPNAEIKNLGLIDPDVNAGTAVGCLIGHLVEGSVTDCYVEGGSVRGRAAVGGLVGYSRSFNLLNCYSTASVTGEKGVGGLVGYGRGNISNSYSSSSVTGDWEVGGLVGYNRSAVSNSYSSSSVTGGSRVGGLVGYNRSAVFNCYSSGSVAGDSNVGGLVGYDYKSYGDYTASFWDSEVVNPDVNGVGNLDEPNVVRLPTVLMQTESTFADAGWDFSTPIWKFCSLPDYPKLAWQVCPGPVEPVGMLAELGEMVEELGLSEGVENSLLAKVEAAIRVLEDDNEKNDGAAVNILGAFINAVEAQSGKKIPESQADVLIAEAAAIIEAIESGTEW